MTKKPGSVRRKEITFIIPHRPEESLRKTVEGIRKSAGQGLKGRIIGVTGNQPSCQRNRAAARARGEYLYFLDNDSLLAPRSLRLALELFRKHPRAAVVGGPSLTPPDDSFLQKTFGLVLSSVFAVGSGIRSRYTPLGRPRAATEYELILCNMIIRTEVFRKAGGFNERIYPNEENILINDIRKAGHEVYYHPGVRVTRSQRESFPKFLLQMATYGRGRADQIFSQPRSFRFFHLLPSGFFLYILGLLPMAFLTGRFVFLPLILYAFLNVFFSLYTALYQQNFRVLPLLPGLFFCVHFCYGAGLVEGVLKNALRRAGFLKAEKKTACKIDYEASF